MAGDKTKITILTTLASLIYITFVVLSVLNVFSTEFHDTKLEEEYSGSALIMSLSFDTYSVLVILCYVADFLWLVYAVSCIFRQGSGTEIFSARFFAAYIINLAFAIPVAFLWVREPLDTFILFLFQLIFLALAFFFHSFDLKDYMSQNDKTEENKCDVWSHRFVVQNGLLFALSAQLYLFINAVSMFMVQEMGVSDASVSLGMIIFLGVLTIVWFAIEGFVIRDYTQYTFAAYIVTIFYMSCIIAPVWSLNGAKTTGGFVIFSLVASCVLFVIRVFLLAYRSSKRGSYENITYNVRADAINV